MLQDQLKLLSTNIEKLEKLTEDLTDNLDSKKRKINFLKEQIESSIKKIDEIIVRSNADT